MDYQPACYKCRMEAGKDAAGVKESSLCIPHLRARNAELEKSNERWHEIADGFIGKKLDTHLGDKICIIGWKRDEFTARNAELEAEVERLRGLLK